MTFLQPFILWALPLILLPVIIHLLNRMRHRPQPWAAMRFLVSATRSSVNNARLRQWLILALRVLAVLMLVLFLSRPLAGGWLGWALSPAPDAILILLDRSASMEARIPGGTISKREQAVRSLSDAAKQFEESSHLILIDSATRAPQVVGNARVLRDLPLTAATDTAADLPGLLASGVDWLVQNRAGTAEIWIASDLQRSNWQPDDPRWQSLITQLDALPQRVRIRLLALNEPGEPNRAVSVREMIRRLRAGQSELQFALDIDANAARTEAVPITINLNGTRTQQELKLDGQALRWRHRLGLGQQTGNGWGHFELPADSNARDNIAYFVYGAETPLRASIVSDGSMTARLLRLAVGAGTRGTALRADILPSSNLGRAVWEDNTLLVWQEPIPTGATAQRVRTFVEQGGTVLFFPTGTGDAQRFEGLGWGETQSTTADKPFRIVRWNQDEGPLAKSDEGFSLPLVYTEFQRRQAITGQKTVLAAFDDGAPFLVRQNLGRGEIYFCASLPDRVWSTLADGPVLVPMIQRLLQSGSRRLQQAMTVAAGELSAVDQGLRWETVDAPAGSKDIRSDAGVYRSGDRVLAVNRPATEDDPEILDADKARALFGPLATQLLQERRTQGENLQGEIWRIFLFSMLVFLIVEAVLILPARPAQQQAGRMSPSMQAGRATPVEAGA